MTGRIRRLRLQKGDLVVTRNHHDAESVVKAMERDKNIPQCVVLVVSGSIHRLSRDYLLRLLS